MENENTSVLQQVARRKSFLIATAIVVVTDQVARLVAQLTIKPEGYSSGDSAPVHEFIDGVLHWQWGQGGFVIPEGPPVLQIISGIVAFVFWGAIFYWVAVRSGPSLGLTRLAAGLLLGGIASNLLDLAIFGHTRNFMLLGFDHPLSAISDGQSGIVARPIFSTAAVAMVLGLIALIVLGLLGKTREPKPKSEPPPPPQPRKRPSPGRPNPGGSAPTRPKE
ncbi:MAG: signal peptidase II [Planctomycetes bacterium]|nr:signal peptidase II [Planctomycetota bacterium]